MAKHISDSDLVGLIVYVGQYGIPEVMEGNLFMLIEVITGWDKDHIAGALQEASDRGILRFRENSAEDSGDEIPEHFQSQLESILERADKKANSTNADPKPVGLYEKLKEILRNIADKLR